MGKQKKKLQKGGAIKLPKARLGLEALKKAYPSLIPIDTDILTNPIRKRIQDAEALHRLLSYRAGEGFDLAGQNAEAYSNFLQGVSTPGWGRNNVLTQALDYDIGKLINDKNINAGDLIRHISKFSDPTGQFDTLYGSALAGVESNEEAKEKMLELILQRTKQKDFLKRNPFGISPDIREQRIIDSYNYDHKSNIRDWYSGQGRLPGGIFQGKFENPDPVYNFDDALLTNTSLQPYQGGPAYAIGSLFANQYPNQRSAMNDVRKAMNKEIYNAPKGSWISDATMKTPDSYILGMNAMLRAAKNNPKTLGNLQPLLYRPINEGSLMDQAFFNNLTGRGNRLDQFQPSLLSKMSRSSANKQIRRDIITDFDKLDMGKSFKNSEDFETHLSRLRNAIVQERLNNLYTKYNFKGIPGLTYDLSQRFRVHPNTAAKNQFLGSQQHGQTGFFPSYAVQKLDYSPSINIALDKIFKKGGLVNRPFNYKPYLYGAGAIGTGVGLLSGDEDKAKKRSNKNKKK